VGIAHHHHQLAAAGAQLAAPRHQLRARPRNRGGDLEQVEHDAARLEDARRWCSRWPRGRRVQLAPARHGSLPTLPPSGRPAAGTRRGRKREHRRRLPPCGGRGASRWCDSPDARPFTHRRLLEKAGGGAAQAAPGPRVRRAAFCVSSQRRGRPDLDALHRARPVTSSARPACRAAGGGMGCGHLVDGHSCAGATKLRTKKAHRGIELGLSAATFWVKAVHWRARYACRQRRTGRWSRTACPRPCAASTRESAKAGWSRPSRRSGAGRRR